jgi:pimeloyl-ACP methyl ester carboxylesterase
MAAAHFKSSFSFETDCWDTHFALQRAARDSVRMSIARKGVLLADRDLRLGMRLAVIAAFFLAATAGSSLAISDSAPSVAPRPPGRLIDLGGYKLHLLCSGRGRPTIVLIPGAGDFSFDWSLVQSSLSRRYRVCSYDRAGEAWSELGPKPRTRTQEAFDLRRLLAKAGESAPFVLVGHSLGGDVARLFRIQYPSAVAGIVFVDSAPPDSPIFINGKLGPATSFSRGRAIPRPRTEVAESDELTDEDRAKINEWIAANNVRPQIDAPFDRLPPRERSWRLWALAKPSHFVALDSDYFGEEAVRMRAADNAGSHPYGDTPLVVLLRDATIEPYHDPKGTSAQQSLEIHGGTLARLSTRGSFRVVPGSTHHIYIDHSAAVIAAVEKVVALVGIRRSSQQHREGRVQHRYNPVRARPHRPTGRPHDQ